MIKVAAPLMALRIIDDAIRHSARRECREDAGLARTYARSARCGSADGPDEVHRRAIARLEFRAQMSEQGLNDDALGVGSKPMSWAHRPV